MLTDLFAALWNPSSCCHLQRSDYVPFLLAGISLSSDFENVWRQIRFQCCRTRP